MQPLLCHYLHSKDASLQGQQEAQPLSAQLPSPPSQKQEQASRHGTHSTKTRELV